METTPIAYAFKRRHGPHRVLCLACCGGEIPSPALHVHDTDEDRASFGAAVVARISQDGKPTMLTARERRNVIVCHGCSKRLDTGEVCA